MAMKLYYGFETKDLFPWCGKIFKKKYTKGTQLWEEIIEDESLPIIPKNVVVLLTGRKHKKINNLGEVQRGQFNGQNFWTIALFDIDEEEMNFFYELVNEEYPYLFNKTKKKRIKLLYLKKVYLHEVGHTKSPNSSEGKGERFADRYAWKILYKKFHKEDVLKTVIFYWFYEFQNNRL